MIVRAYFRVSDDDLKLENQYPDAELLAKRRGWTIERVYTDTKSAAKRRPEFEKMLADAEAHKFDTLIIYAIDRFGRSLAGNLDDIRRLDRAGVSVVSHRETWLDTTTGPLRHLLVAIFSYVAESERANLIDRTNAGLKRAKAEGIRLGRPPASQSKLTEAMKLIEGGLSMRKAAARVGIGATTLRSYCAEKGSRLGPPGSPLEAQLGASV